MVCGHALALSHLQQPSRSSAQAGLELRSATCSSPRGARPRLGSSCAQPPPAAALRGALAPAGLGHQPPFVEPGSGWARAGADPPAALRGARPRLGSRRRWSTSRPSWSSAPAGLGLALSRVLPGRPALREQSL